MEDSDTETDSISADKNVPMGKDMETKGAGEKDTTVYGVTNPRKRKALTEETLCGTLGIQRMAAEFKDVCKFNGRGYEAMDLRNMLGKYKEWAFQMHPSNNFIDVLHAVEVLGSKAYVRQGINRLRDIERDRYIVSCKTHSSCCNLKLIRFVWHLL